MILHHLPATVRRPLVATVSAVLVRFPVLPADGRAARLVSRRLLADAKAGGRHRARAIRAVRRLDRHANPSSALLSVQILFAAEQPELAKQRLVAAAERWPCAGRLRFAVARALLRSGDMSAAGRHLVGAVDGDTRGLVVSHLLDTAVEARSTAAITAIRRALPNWSPAVDRRVAERVRRWAAVADAVERHRRDDDAALAVSLAGGKTARLAVRWALDEGRSSLLRRVCEAVEISQLDRWTAKHAAVVLRRSGDLSLSTALAAQSLRLRPDDAKAQRMVEVGHAGLRTLADGWVPPVRSHDVGYRGRDRSVAYLLHNSLPHSSAGYATRTHGLLRTLVHNGWDVHGVTRLGFPFDQTDPKDDRRVPAVDEIDGVHYHRLVDSRRVYRKWPIGSYVDDYARRVEQLVRTHRLGIVHGASNYWNGFAAVGAARRLGLPSVYEVRGLWELTRMSRDPGYDRSELFALSARLEADACLHADHVLTITGALRDLMVERGVPEAKITVIPNGVDTMRFTPGERDAELARQLGVAGKVVIGYVGSILDYEGIDTLLHAVAGLWTRRQDFHLLVVGDGAVLDSCRSLAESLGLADVVTFTGRIAHHEVERYYSLVDIAPFPRKPLPVCEAVSPLKPFEAMATGKVPVVSSVAALAEIVTDGENGLVFDKGDVEALATALERLVADSDLRKRLSTAARSWVVRERDWGVLVRRLEAVYADLIAGRRPGQAAAEARVTS